MNKTVSVLGINGRVGQAAARAFVTAGWRVIGMGRANRAQIAGVEFFEGDAHNPSDVRAATADADMVINALNLPYDKWDKGRYEALTKSVIEGMAGSGKTMIFAGNIYNYAAADHVLTPQTPHRPETDKGEIREHIEAMLTAAARRGNFRFIVMRSPDFYGPGAVETNFDLAMMARIKSNVLQYPGPLGLGHSWAYLPDLGRAYVRVAEEAEQFGPVEELLFAGHFATGQEMVAAIQSVLPRKAKVTLVPMWLLSLLGMFVPVVREVVKMSYLWHTPQRLSDPRLEALLGEDFGTPFEEAVARTTQSYLPAVEGTAQTHKVVA